jgi:hypothetical protein
MPLESAQKQAETQHATPALARSQPSHAASVNVNEVAVLVEKTTFEKHYRVGELAELWGLGRETVRKLIMNEPGVIKIRLGRRKAHTMYSVPQSVAERVHTRLLNAA